MATYLASLDGHAASGANISLSEELPVGETGNVSFIIFRDVVIPDGAVISKAVIAFVAADSSSAACTVNVAALPPVHSPAVPYVTGTVYAEGDYVLFPTGLTMDMSCYVATRQNSGEPCDDSDAWELVDSGLWTGGWSASGPNNNNEPYSIGQWVWVDYYTEERNGYYYYVATGTNNLWLVPAEHPEVWEQFYDWDGGITYVPGCRITFGTKYYICIKQTNLPPPNTLYWEEELPSVPTPLTAWIEDFNSAPDPEHIRMYGNYFISGGKAYVRIDPSTSPSLHASPEMQFFGDFEVLVYGESSFFQYQGITVTVTGVAWGMNNGENRHLLGWDDEDFTVDTEALDRRNGERPKYIRITRSGSTITGSYKWEESDPWEYLDSYGDALTDEFLSPSVAVTVGVDTQAYVGGNVQNITLSSLATMKVGEAISSSPISVSKQVDIFLSLTLRTSTGWGYLPAEYETLTNYPVGPYTLRMVKSGRDLSSVEYTLGQRIVYNRVDFGNGLFSGEFYGCKLANIGHGPPDPTYWVRHYYNTYNVYFPYIIGDTTWFGYGGDWYVCIQDNIGKPFTNSAYWRKDTTVYPEWNFTTAYTEGAIVKYYNGSRYVCLSSNTGQYLTTQAYWGTIVGLNFSGSMVNLDHIMSLYLNGRFVTSVFCEWNNVVTAQADFFTRTTIPLADTPFIDYIKIGYTPEEV